MSMCESDRECGHVKWERGELQRQLEDAIASRNKIAKDFADMTALNGYQEKEIVRLNAIMAGDAIVKALDYTPEGGLNLKVSHPLVAAMAGQLVHFFKESGGQNYVELTLRHKEEGTFIMTVQRALGKTPHQFRTDAEFKVADLEKEITRLTIELGKHAA